MAKEWALGAAVLFAVTTALRTRTAGTRWHALIPGGIAVAVGMYNVPSFTLARTIGGLFGWWWRARMGWKETPLIVLASVSLQCHPSLFLLLLGKKKKKPVLRVK